MDGRGLDARHLEAIALRSNASLQSQWLSSHQSLERSIARNMRNVESAMFHKVRAARKFLTLLISRFFLCFQFDEAVAKHMALMLADAVAVGLERAVVPSFERACRDMLKQVHAALQSGISQSLAESQQELFASLEANLKTVRRHPRW